MEVEKKAEKKIVGGKLIKVKVTVDGDLIKRVRITGDFFMHPEEKIIELERSLRDVKLRELEQHVNRWFKNNDVILIGVSPQDFADVITDAVKQ